jgi:hypothetical protein
MDGCEIVAVNSAWYCKTHECRMSGTQVPPVLCLKVRPMTSKERKWLQKEQRLLTYRFYAGTLTREDRQRMAEVKELLNPS